MKHLEELDVKTETAEYRLPVNTEKVVKSLTNKIDLTSTREELIHTAFKDAETQEFRWMAKSGCVKTMRLFAGYYGVEKVIGNDEGVLGISLAEVHDVVLKIPDGLKRIKTRVGEDSDGSFLA